MAKATANDDTTKAACLYMLRRGLASDSELERLSKRSKQIIGVWRKQYPNARAEYLAKMWEKALLSSVKNRQCG